MRQKPETQYAASERLVKDIQRKTRKQYGAEEKIRIVLDGLRGEEWRSDYNQNRPHSSLNWHTPLEFANRSNRDHNRNRVNL